MKKILHFFTSAALMLLFVFGAQAQVLTESFEGSFPPTNWAIVNNGSGNNWTQNTDASNASDGSNSMKYGYNSSNNADTWAFTKGLSLTNGQVYDITFDYKVASSSYPEKLKVTVGNAQTVASQTTTLWDNNGGTDLTNTSFAQASFQFTAPSTGTFYFAFNCYSDADQYILFVDNIVIDVPPSCPAPSGQTESSITTTGANLGWTDASGSHWDVYVTSSGGAAPTQGTTPTANDITSNPYTYSGGTSGTTYDWYVRSDCDQDNTGTSTWTGPHSFTTTCVTQSTPWSEDFESMSTVGSGIVPNCMLEDGDWATADASQSYNRAAHTGNKYVYTRWTADDWLFTPEISVTAGTSYDFTFYYVTDGNSGWTTVETKYGTGQTSADMTTSIGSALSGPTNTTYQKYTATFTPSSSGNFYFGIHVVANGDPWYITFDDLKLEETPSCTAPTAQTESSITTTGANLGWTDASGSHWDIYVTSSGGAAPTQGSTPTANDVTASPYTYSGGSSNTTYDWYVRSDCDQDNVGTSTWTGPSNFTTTALAPGCATSPTPADAATGVTAGTVTLSWTAPVDDATHDAATSYDVYLGTASGSLSLQGNTANTTYDVNANIDLQTYYWKIVPKNSAGSATGCSEWSFSTHITQSATTQSAPWSDDFSTHPGGTGTTTNGWLTNPTSGFAWTISTDGTTPSSSTGPAADNTGDDHFIFTEASGSNPGDVALLYSPKLDLSALTTPELTFYYHMYGTDMGDLHIDVYNGSAYTNDVATALSGQQQSAQGDAWLKYTIDLSSYSGTIHIRFRGVRGSQYTGDMSIDDFSIHETPTCPDPTAQTEASITTTGADLGWTDASGSHWDVYVTSSGGAAPTQGSTPTANDVTSNPYTYSGGSISTTYDWYVRSDCDQDNTGTSAWVGPSSFTTSDGKAVNPTPADNAIDIAISSKTLDWDDVANATGYHISVGTTSGGTDIVNNVAISGGTNSTYTVSSNWLFNQDYYWTVTSDFSGSSVTGTEWSFMTVDGKAVNPTPANAATGVLTTSKTLDWDDVTDATGYHISVGTTSGGTDVVNNAAISGATNSTYTVSSNWNYSTEYFWTVTTDYSGGTVTGTEWNFISECGTYSSFPYTQGFSSWSPICWDTDHSTTGSTDNWIQYGSNAARANFYSQTAGKTDIMVSPTIDVSGLTTPSLDFKWSHKLYASGNKDSLSVEITDDGGTSWHQVWTKGGSNLESNDGAGNTAPGSYVNSGDIDLSSYGNTIQIRFYATSDYGDDLFIDNFRIREMPTCLDPTAQTEANISTSGADLGWTDASGSHWDVYVTSSGGAAPTQGTTPTANDLATKSYSWSGGSAYTTYDWYVRSDCNQDNTGTSSWVGPHSFTTSKVVSSTLAGKTSKCSPQFTRPNGGTPPTTQSSYTVFYDKFSVTIGTTGKYDILSDQDYDGYLHIYENSFDPADPMTNVIGGDDDNTNGNGAAHGSKIEGLSLTAGTTYIIVGSGYGTTGIGTISFWIEGAATVTMPSATDHYGYPYRTYTVPATDGTSRSSNYECDDTQGWTTYYDDNGTSSDYTDDNLLFAILKKSSDLGATTVTVAGAAGASFIDASTTFSKYVNSFHGWYVFNRYWNVSVGTEPSADVIIRFYYKDDDFTKLNNALSGAGRNTIANRVDMSALKINDLNGSGYDPNPANGHTGVPKATAYNADGAWIYNAASSSSSNKWTAGDYNSDHYFEYTVAHFSGGGGGAAGNANDGSLPVELVNFTAYAKGAINIINWATASEYNADYFIIERANLDFSKVSEIGRIKASGNSNSLVNYSFNDLAPLNEAYYRIINVDIDGKTKAYNWKLVKRDIKEFSLLALFPNPTSTKLTIQLASPNNEKATIQLCDLSGRVILEKEVEFNNGFNQDIINVSTLNSGSYLLKIRQGNSIISKLIIKK